jgi:EAL domain-containing protein (putative c-di-GMP-specific phosphodiesterase class I)
MFEVALDDRVSRKTWVHWLESLRHHIEKPLRPKALSFVIHPRLRVGLDISTKRTNTALGIRAQSALKACTQARPIVIYQPEAQRKKVHHIQLESEIRSGLRKNEFISYFQPKIDPQTQKIAGAEALVRWHRPGHGTMFPKEFIDVAEQSELIHEIGTAVADQTVDLLTRLSKKNKEVPISINLSDGDIDHDSKIIALGRKLVERRLNMQMVSFEVSEKIVALDDSRHRAFFKLIDKQGFELALDDFGTAYSSLARLTYLPVREIKLDRSFLKQAKASTKGLKLLISTAKMLLLSDYRVTLEGIERAKELRILKLLPGCLAQGFFFSPALPAHELERLL